MKFFYLFACLLLFLVESKSIDVNCWFNKNDWFKLGAVYECEVMSSLKITSKELAVINSVNGTHMNKKTIEDVDGFVASGSLLHYFPRGLENLFPNLKAVKMNRCGLKEINQSDLKPLTKLTHLFLDENKIKSLQNGLFDYNQQLQLIALNSNPIYNIDQNVFNHLDNLNDLWLRRIVCTDVYGENAVAIKIAIEKIKSECNGEDYLVVDRNLTKLEGTLNNRNYKEFLEMLEEIEKSRYASHHKDRIQELTAWKDLKIWTINNKIDHLERSMNLLNTKFENLEKILMEISNNLAARKN